MVRRRLRRSVTAVDFYPGLFTTETSGAEAMAGEDQSGTI